MSTETGTTDWRAESKQAVLATHAKYLDARLLAKTRGVIDAFEEIERTKDQERPLPAAFGAVIRATVTCGCGDQNAGQPVPDVVLSRDEDFWRTKAPLPCGCVNAFPKQDGGGDLVTDVRVLFGGAPS